MEERQVAGAAGSSQNKAGEVTICIEHPGKFLLRIKFNEYENKSLVLNAQLL